MMLMIKTQNCHNLANFAATTCRFCMVVDINDTYGLYFHAKFYVYFANKLMRTHLAYLYYTFNVCKISYYEILKNKKLL